MPTYFTDEQGRYLPERTESRAHLTVLSDVLNPEAITQRLGISPDESWVKGIARHGRPAKHHGWTVRSRVLPAMRPEEHLAELLGRLEPEAAKIRELAGDPDIVSVALWLVRHGDNWNPGLSLTDELITKLDSLGVGLEIDIYVADWEEGPVRPREHKETPPQPH